MLPVLPSAPCPPDGDPADLVRQAAAALASGNRSLLLSRVDAGRICDEYFRTRQAAGFTDRAESSGVLAAALRPHARNKRECDPNMLSKLYGTVQLLADGDGWKDSGLTLGRLEALVPLVIRDTLTETCSLYMPAKEQECKALFAAACGSGAKRISLPKLRKRVRSILKLDEGPDGGPLQPQDGGRGADTDGPTGSDQRGTVTGNLLDPDQPYTAKDAADLSVGVLAKSDAPDDALEALLLAVAKSTDFSAKGKRAVKAALVILQRGDSAGPSPVQVAAGLVPAAVAS